MDFLLIDDDEAFASVLRRALIRRGYLARGSWVIRPVPSRTPSRMACWIIPTILGRRCWMG